MLFNYSNILIFTLVGVAFIFVTLFIGSLIRPSAPSQAKATIYECGEPPVGQAWINFNIRFYVIALVFVIFDVEAVFMFPVLRVFKELLLTGNGLMAFLEIFVFVLMLVLGFAYVWKKGDLDWVKKV